MKPITYRCLRTLQSEKGLHAVGDTVELAEVDGQALIALGVVELVPVDEEPLALLGCDHLPATVVIGDREIAAGEIVRRAFEATGLSVEDWNALTVEERAHRCDALICTLRPAAPEQTTEAAQSAAAAAAEAGGNASGTSAAGEAAPPAQAAAAAASGDASGALAAAPTDAVNSGPGKGKRKG